MFYSMLNYWRVPKPLTNGTDFSNTPYNDDALSITTNKFDASIFLHYKAGYISYITRLAITRLAIWLYNHIKVELMADSRSSDILRFTCLLFFSMALTVNQ